MWFKYVTCMVHSIESHEITVARVTLVVVIPDYDM